MDPADFYFFISPLAALVGILAVSVLYYARREERADAELRQIKMEFQSGTLNKKEFDEKRKALMQSRVFAEELEKLQSLFENRSIDRETYSRLKKIISHAQSTEPA
jgi:hypothetical protein